MKLKRVKLIKWEVVGRYSKTNPTFDREHQSELFGDEHSTNAQSNCHPLQPKMT